MDPVTILALINGLLSTAMNVWSSARKVMGEDAIPAWEDILLANSALQDKIDAEKEPSIGG